MLNRKGKRKKLKPLYKFKGRCNSEDTQNYGEGDYDEATMQYDTDLYGLNPAIATVLRVLYDIDVDCCEDSIESRCWGNEKYEEDDCGESTEGDIDYFTHTFKRIPDAIIDRNEEDDKIETNDPEESQAEDDHSFVPSESQAEDDDSFVPSAESQAEDDDSFVSSAESQAEAEDNSVVPSLYYTSDDEGRESSMRYHSDGFYDGDNACIDLFPSSTPEADLQQTRKLLQKRITKALNREGLSRYLRSSLAGTISMKNAKAIIVKVVRFLVWTYCRGYSRGKSSKAFIWFKKMIIHNYAKIGEYCTYLENVKEFEPTTIKNNLGALTKCAKWAILFPKKANPKITPVHLAGFMEVVKTFQKSYSKANRKKRSSKTMESEVYLSKMPAGGLPELQGTFDAEITWLQSLVKLAHDDQSTHPGQPFFPITAAEYTRLTSAMYAAIYSFAPNGRVSGIEDLKEFQYEQLVDEGHVHSSKFKTNTRYGYQPVILSTVSYFFVKIYWIHFRPVAMKNSELAHQQPMQRSLWLTFDGKPERIGPRVTQYFKRTLGMHITTTAIRSLVETTTEKLAKAGAISEAQRDAVSNINGHTSQVTKDFYLMMDRNADVCRAREALDTVMPMTTPLRDLIHSPSAPAKDSMLRLESPPTWTGHTQDILRVADWGTEHPDYEKRTVKGNNAVKRAVWTDEEIEYIAEYCTQKLRTNPDAKSIIVKCCFQHIQRDPDALPIFHRNHVLDSSRLRSGYRAAIQRGLLPKH